MKRYLGFASLLVVVFTTVGNGQQTGTAQPARNPFLRLSPDGAWWNNLPPEAKNDFLDGYTMAMSRANYLAYGTCMEDKKKLTPGPGFDATMNGIIGMCVLAQFYDFNVDGGDKVLSSELDSFYSDDENSHIPINLSLQYVKDKLKGNTTPNDLKKQLSQWRSIMNK